MNWAVICRRLSCLKVGQQRWTRWHQNDPPGSWCNSETSLLNVMGLWILSLGVFHFLFLHTLTFCIVDLQRLCAFILVLLDARWNKGLARYRSHWVIESNVHATDFSSSKRNFQHPSKAFCVIEWSDSFRNRLFDPHVSPIFSFVFNYFLCISVSYVIFLLFFFNFTLTLSLLSFNGWEISPKTLVGDMQLRYAFLKVGIAHLNRLRCSLFWLCADALYLHFAAVRVGVPRYPFSSLLVRADALQ